MNRDSLEKIDQLVAKARTGDRQAFSKIVTMMMNQVVALAYRITGDSEAARDIAQDSFVAAWENLGGYRAEARFSTWLYQIVSNRAINLLKKADSHREVHGLDHALNAAESSLDPEREMSRKELVSGLIEFMRRLPEQQRLVFELRYYQQMSFGEIADTIGRAEGTAKTHYRQAVAKLREFARQKGWHQ
jgi:RNA polymerase sigma-70 factor (ECF subfamily)